MTTMTRITDHGLDNCTGPLLVYPLNNDYYLVVEEKDRLEQKHIAESELNNPAFWLSFETIMLRLSRILHRDALHCDSLPTLETYPLEETLVHQDERSVTFLLSDVALTIEDELMEQVQAIYPSMNMQRTTDWFPLLGPDLDTPSLEGWDLIRA